MYSKYTFFIIISTMALAGCSKSPLHFSNSSSSLESVASCGNRNSTVFPSDLRRLSKTEFQNTIRDLFPVVMSDPTSGVPDIITNMSTDFVKGGFETMIRGVSARNVGDYFNVAANIGNYMTAGSPNRLGVLLGSQLPCMANIDSSSVTDASANSCVTSFIQSFGKKIYRRPLTTSGNLTSPGEVEDLMNLYLSEASSSRLNALGMVLTSMLISPNFLYKVETDGTAVAGVSDTYKITPYQFATRISYMLWASTPDDALLQAADDGTLMTDAGLKGQLTRMTQNQSKLKNAVQDFFQGWFQTEITKDVLGSTSFVGALNTTGLRAAMVNELLQFATTQAVDKNGNYASLLTTASTPTDPANLASVYASDPSTRVGILGRAARLVDGRDYTAPILRGVFMARQMLCNDLPSPDPSKFPPNFQTPPPDDPTKTGRQRWTEKTSAPQCLACHGQINPLGFAFEHFDAAGRYRGVETTTDLTGIVHNLTIDDAVDLPVDTGKTVHVAGVAEMSSALAASRTGNECYAKQWIRYSYGRMDSPVTDTCAVQDLNQAQIGSGTSINMFVRLALTPEFQLRKYNFP